MRHFEEVSKDVNSNCCRLISDGRAIPFTAHAAAPTVTMPRVKALTTGSIPSFLDVILNIAESDTTSSLANQDTWLAQIQARGGKLTMFGDDTWLKLFPGMFERSDGTSSFFVSVCGLLMSLGKRKLTESLRTLPKSTTMLLDILTPS